MSSKKRKLASNNTTGYAGVYKKGERFYAQIRIDGKKYHLGTFDSAKEAAVAYDFAAIKGKRPKSDLNFPFLYNCRVIES